MKYIYAMIFIVLALLVTGCGNTNNPSINDSSTIVGTEDNTQTDTLDQIATSDNSSDVDAGDDIEDSPVSNITIPVDETPIETPEVDVPDDDTSDTDSKSLKKLLVDRTLKYTAEYTISADESMDDIIQVFDLPKYVTITRIGDDETRTIFDGESMIVCTSTGESWQCFKMPVEQSQSTQVEDEVNDGTATITVIGTCNVASEAGTKYEITAEDGTKSQVCYTSDGILLLIAREDPAYYMVATTITRSVDNSLFVSPVEPQDLSELMG
jgi:hypothetical protein